MGKHEWKNLKSSHKSNKNFRSNQKLKTKH